MKTQFEKVMAAIIEAPDHLARLEIAEHFRAACRPGKYKVVSGMDVEGTFASRRDAEVFARILHEGLSRPGDYWITSDK